MRVTVLRAFLLGGVRQEPGVTIEVADSFGRELVQVGKAERVAGDPLPASIPMTVRDTPALVPPVAEPEAPEDGATEGDGPDEPQADAAEPRRRRRKGIFHVG